MPEPCDRCGEPTVTKLLKKGRRDKPELMIECQRCGWLRPVYQSRWPG